MSPLLPSGRRRAGGTQDARAIPRRPYRDTTILHGVLAALICAFAFVTGGNLGTAAVVAAAYFVVATMWSWWRLSQRIRVARAAPRGAAGAGTDQEGEP